MKTTLKSLALGLLAALAVLLAPQASFAQQNLLVQTTLSTAVAAPASPGAPPVPSNLVTIASVTGIQAISGNGTSTINQQNQWVIFIDREAMAVVNFNGTTLQVLRGWNSTVATSHVAGAMVLYGRASWFYQYDPGTTLTQGGGSGPSGGTACTVAGQYAFPWLNIRTGSMWACSPTTLSYVPWFNNPMTVDSAIDFGTAASVAGAQPILGPLFRVSGTAAITSFTIPVGLNATAVGGGSFCIYPTAAFTTTATNNIAAASTAIAGKTLCFQWNAATAKFSASY